MAKTKKKPFIEMTFSEFKRYACVFAVLQTADSMFTKKSAKDEVFEHLNSLENEDDVNFEKLAKLLDLDSFTE